MKVRIIKSEAWHSGKVGQVFNVEGVPGGNVYVTDPGPYKGNGLCPSDYEVVVDKATKIVTHEGKRYEVPVWVKFLTRDATGSPVTGFEFEPEWTDCDGEWENPQWCNKVSGKGRVAQNIKEYVPAKPEGNFIREV